MNNKASKPKVLYISYDGMTDPLGQSQVLPYLEGLSKAGFEIHLLSFEKNERLLKGRSTIEAICEAAGIKWYPQLYTKQPPILSTIKDLYLMRTVASSLHSIHGFSIVHARSYIAGMAAKYMKAKFGLKFLFDMRGFWADERVDGGLWNLKNPLFKTVYKFFKKQERQMLKQADAIVSLTYAAKDEMAKWNDVGPQPLPITVIPCCVDTDLFNESHVDNNLVKQFQDKLGLSDDVPVMLYLGSIGTWYLLDEMLAFFKVWLKHFPTYKLLFITKDNPAHILQKAATVGIEQSVLIMPAERHEMPSALSLGSLSIFFIKPAYSKMASSPVKQGELMSMGIPVICNKGVGDTDKIISDYDAGILVEQFTDDDYEAAILNWENYQVNHLELQRGARQYFGLNNGIASYISIYNEFISKKGKL